MIEREKTCRACEGAGMLADDEGWQYQCSVCHGMGMVDLDNQKPVRLMNVDVNNRLLD